MSIFTWLQKHPLVSLAREFAYEVSCGCLGAWLVLMGFEIVRPGALSPFIELNGLLGLGVGFWLVGWPQRESRRLARYASASLFGILVALVSWALSFMTLWQWLVLPFGLLAAWLWFMGSNREFRS